MMYFIKNILALKSVKNSFLVLICITAMSFTIWHTDFDKAKQIAKENHQLILLNFSGSDWCGPCMRMRKEIFDDKNFLAMADTSLVLINADFPRNKKNKLDAISTKKNEALADEYNPDGKFPLTLLLNADGKIIKTWDGLPNETAKQLAQQIKIICDGNRK